MFVLVTLFNLYYQNSAIYHVYNEKRKFIPSFISKKYYLQDYHDIKWLGNITFYIKILFLQTISNRRITRYLYLPLINIPTIEIGPASRFDSLDYEKILECWLFKFIVIFIRSKDHRAKTSVCFLKSSIFCPYLYSSIVIVYFKKSHAVVLTSLLN